MSKLKVSENLFLEVAELNRLVQFLKQDGYELVIKSLIKSYGIVPNAANSNYKVTAKAGTTNGITINSGIAFDTQLRAILMEQNLEMVVENTGSTRWVVLQYLPTNYEQGTVSVTADGSLVGIGTEFTKVLRGQPNFPTKVKLDSTLNTEEYEVVNVINDNSATLSGSFVAEQNKQYAVMGAFTPGFVPADDNKLIYEYDSYQIQLIDSVDTPSLTSDQFILASIEFSSGGMIVTDKRAAYMFNSVEGEISTLPSQDNLVSLLRVQRIQSNLLELTIEHGYSVSRFEIADTATSTIFRILNGSCNFLGSGDIPNDLFKGWFLVNKNTLKRMTIDSNTNKDLYVSEFNDEVIAGDSSAFIIVPPYYNLEYQISYSGTNINALPSYHSVTQGSNINKLLIPAPYGELTIGLRYRLLNGYDSTPWQKFAIAEYTNENGEKQMIGDSQFIISVNEPVVELRNYS